MAVYTQVPAEVLAAFLRRFDVGELVSAKGIAEGVENSNYLVDTTGKDGGGGRFILTLYEKRVAAGDLPFFRALTDHLAAKGNPVPRMIADRDGAWLHELEGRPACLIEFLPGVSATRPTAAQARNAGAALGRMHASTADFVPCRRNTMGVDSWGPLFERCGRSLDEIAPGLHDQLAWAIDDTTSGWFGDDFDHCAIHADLFPDNVLMRGDAVSGLIDVYFACTDIRVYDLAVAHTAWGFDAGGRRYDAAIGDALVAGYERHFPLSPFEWAQFNTLAVGACIRFTLSRAWDWLNTPADALVTRKDPMGYWHRAKHYDPEMLRSRR